MTERILTFNGYGGSNPRGGELKDWVERFKPDVCLISELGDLKDNLRPLGRLVYADGDTPTDVGVLVLNGKVDDVETKRLTQFVPRGEPKPMLWRDRWYARVRINDRVYYAIHGNAAVANNNGQWLPGRGADVWKIGVTELKQRVKRDIDKGYAVRVGGDWNFPMSNNPPKNSPQDFYKDLGMNYIHDRVMWVGWDSRYDKLVNKTITGVAPGADAHHNLLIALEEKQKPNPPKGDGKGGEPDAGKKTYPVDITTTFLGSLNPSQIAQELEETRKDLTPDLWAVQGAKQHLDLLREVNGYGVATRGESCAVLFNRDVFRPAPDKSVRGVLTASFVHKASDTTVRLVTANLGNDEGKLFTEQVKEASRNEAVAFWAGRMDLDADRNKAFKEAGLVSAHGELSENNNSNDFIGSFEADKRVSAKVATKFKVNGHNRVRARYSLAVQRNAAGPRDESGSPTEVEDPDPRPPKQKFERDNGPSEDHTECCDGKSL